MPVAHWCQKNYSWTIRWGFTPSLSCRVQIFVHNKDYVQRLGLYTPLNIGSKTWTPTALNIGLARVTVFWNDVIQKPVLANSEDNHFAKQWCSWTAWVVQILFTFSVLENGAFGRRSCRVGNTRGTTVFAKGKDINIIMARERTFLQRITLKAVYPGTPVDQSHALFHTSMVFWKYDCVYLSCCITPHTLCLIIWSKTIDIQWTRTITGRFPISSFGRYTSNTNPQSKADARGNVYWPPAMPSEHRFPPRLAPSPVTTLVAAERLALSSSTAHSHQHSLYSSLQDPGPIKTHAFKSNFWMTKRSSHMKIGLWVLARHERVKIGKKKIGKMGWRCQE